MAVNVEVNTPLAQAIQDAVQPKLMENGWVADESDTTLAEYVVSMVVRGRNREQIIAELGTDLLGVGEDDPAVGELADWLFEHIPALDAQLSGKPQESEAPLQTEQRDMSEVQDMQVDDAVPNAPSGPRAMRGVTSAGNGRGRGRMIGQLNRQMDRGGGDDKMMRIKGAAGGTGRINSHSGRDSNRRGRGNNMTNGIQRMMGGGRLGQQQNNMPMMDPQQQMQLMQMMEMQNQMMAQMLNGQQPDMSVFNSGGMQQKSSKSLFDRVEKPGRPKNGIGRGAGSINGSQPDIDMGDDGQRKEAFETLCRFNDKCTVPSCPYAHQSPAAPPGTPIDLNDRCSFGAACENRKCAGKHPSPAQRRQHLSQDVDCKFYPNCTNPACPFRHPDMPPCRNGADCTTPGCKFSHSKIVCRYTPCLNPGCVYKHVEGQKKKTTAPEDHVWTATNGTADRLKSLSDHQEQNEELIVPDKDTTMQATEQPVEIVT